MSQCSARFMQFRGGSSKGLYFLASDLPADADVRDQFLLDAVGRDARQIDGLGGGDPLTSKVAIVSLSDRYDADIDYLFVQIVLHLEQPEYLSYEDSILVYRAQNGCLA